MPQQANISWDQALGVLGVAADATETQVRAAYLEKVRQFPPDRDPEQFERIRDAYDQLRDPATRANHVLEGPDPLAPLAGFLGDATAPPRRFVGPDAWMAVLKEKRK